MNEDLARLWAGMAHVARGRLEVLQAALHALEQGHPDAGARRAVAVDEAHKLVGSLDSYGIRGGSDKALEVATLLERPDPPLPALRHALQELQDLLAARPG